MRAWVYRCSRKVDTYLYVEHKDDFSKVPAALVELIGRLELVIDVDLSNRQRLAQADISEVRKSLTQQGFFLQMPPGDFRPEKVC